MTTIAPDAVKPPQQKLTPGQWLRENLFDSLFSTALTLISLAVVVWVLWGLFAWVFDERTQWGVIAANVKLFATGTYPADQLWRVWWVLIIAMAILGVAGGAWQGLLKVYVVGAGACLGLFAFIPFGEAQPWLAAACGATFAGTLAGWRRDWLKLPSLAIWIAVVPLVLLLLVSGRWGLQPLNTQVITGFLLTLILAAASLISAFPLGILLALGRNNDDLPVVKWFCTLTIELIRGIPLTILLFTAWLMVPIFLRGISVDLLIRAIVGFILFTAVYVAEDIRGGLQAIARGQVEAARALGLNPFQITMLVVLPQALRAALPAIVNEFLTLFKDTSLIFIVGMVELLGVTRLVYNQPDWLGTQQEVLAFAAVIYFVFCYGMAFAAKRVEASLKLGDR